MRIPVIPMGESNREIFVDPNASWCIIINALSMPGPLYKYVDDSTLFEICEMIIQFNSMSLFQNITSI